MISRKPIGSLARAARVAAALLAICMILAPRAHADPVRSSPLLQSSVLVSGNYSNLYSLNVNGPGVLTVTLENISWPSRLAQLDCAVYSNSGLLQSLNDTTVWKFETTGPGQFYASILAQAGGSLHLGLFSINVSFEPSGTVVPLPAGVWLLGSVLGLYGLRRALNSVRFVFNEVRIA
jgi:hypothetical protein